MNTPPRRARFRDFDGLGDKLREINVAAAEALRAFGDGEGIIPGAKERLLCIEEPVKTAVIAFCGRLPEGVAGVTSVVKKRKPTHPCVRFYSWRKFTYVTTTIERREVVLSQGGNPVFDFSIRVPTRVTKRVTLLTPWNNICAWYESVER